MLYVQVRPRFCKVPLFDTITEEAERVRLFKEYMKTVKVCVCVCVCLESLPNKEGGRECVHCTLSQ